MPRYKPVAATSNPSHRVPDATEICVPTAAVTASNRTPMNDPG